MSAHRLFGVVSKSSGRRILRRGQHFSAECTSVFPHQVDQELVPFNPSLIHSTSIIPYESDEREISEYFDNRFDEILSAFSTTEPLNVRKRKRGISDNEYYLIKLNEKLKAEMPQLLYPDYRSHDYSIYDPDVQLIINLNKKITWQGLGKTRGAFDISRKFVNVELRKPRLNIIYSKVNRKKGVLKIKWSVTGIPRTNTFYYAQPRLKAYTFISILQLGTDNKVITHEVTNMEIDQGAVLSAKNHLGIVALGTLGLAGGAPGGDDGYFDLEY